MTAYADLSARLSALQREGRHGDAFDLATSLLPAHPRCAEDLTLRRAVAACGLGDPETAVAILRDFLDSGDWYPADWLSSDDLAPAREHPEFASIAATCAERERAAGAIAGPSALVAPPRPSAPRPWPLLVALHGNAENAAAALPYWRPAADHGWLAVLAQASTPCGVDRYAWGAASTGDVRAAVAIGSAVDGCDTATPPVLGGFSRGAWHVLRLAVSGGVAARGVVLVAPSMRTIDEIESSLPDAAARGLRVAIVAGTNDPMAQTAPAIATQLADAGLRTNVSIVDGLAHAYPADFLDRLPALLSFTAGADGFTAAGDGR